MTFGLAIIPKLILYKILNRWHFREENVLLSSLVCDLWIFPTTKTLSCMHQSQDSMVISKIITYIYTKISWNSYTISWRKQTEISCMMWLTRVAFSTEYHPLNLLNPYVTMIFFCTVANICSNIRNRSKFPVTIKILILFLTKSASLNNQGMTWSFCSQCPTTDKKLSWYLFKATLELVCL